MAAGDRVHRHEADIVPVARIAGPGIAEPDQKPHRPSSATGSRAATCRRAFARRARAAPRPALAGAAPRLRLHRRRAWRRTRRRTWSRAGAAPASPRRVPRPRPPPLPPRPPPPLPPPLPPLFAHRGRRGDRGDGEVAADGRPRAVGQRYLADMDAVADVEAVEADRDVLGDGVHRAEQIDLVAHDVEDAAALDAGRILLR